MKKMDKKKKSEIAEQRENDLKSNSKRRKKRGKIEHKGIKKNFKNMRVQYKILKTKGHLQNFENS